jgi:hypothetical protein
MLSKVGILSFVNTPLPIAKEIEYIKLLVDGINNTRLLCNSWVPIITIYYTNCTLNLYQTYYIQTHTYLV